jgi:hypothetical protein
MGHHMHKQYYKDDTTTYEFNPVVWDFESWEASKKEAAAHEAATRRARISLKSAAWVCLALALACAVSGSYITAAMNLIFAIVSFKAASTNLTRY